MQALGLDSVLLDNDARASDDLAWIAFSVNLAQPSPCSKNLGVSDLDEVDLVLCAERLDELDVLGFGASLDEDTEMGLAFVQGFGALAETASETVVHESVLQDLLSHVQLLDGV
jgi:hypothetical protein